MYIKPTKEAKGDIFDIHDDARDLLLYPVTDDVPCPWDASITVENGNVIVSGGMSPGNFSGAKCVCEFPVDYFDKFYKLEVPRTMTSKEFLGAIISAGWEEA